MPYFGHPRGNDLLLIGSFCCLAVESCRKRTKHLSRTADAFWMGFHSSSNHWLCLRLVPILRMSGGTPPSVYIPSCLNFHFYLIESNYWIISISIFVSIYISVSVYVYIYIINYIKAQRLSLFGHIQRMPDTRTVKKIFNPLKPELYSICYLLALLGADHFLHVSRIRVKLLTFRLLMSYTYIYIYIWSTHS